MHDLSYPHLLIAALGQFFADAEALYLQHEDIENALRDSIPSHGSGSTSSAGSNAPFLNENSSSSNVSQSLLKGHQSHLPKESSRSISASSLHDYSETFDSWLLGISDDYKSELESVLGHLLKGLEDTAKELSPYKCDAAEFSPGGVEVRMPLAIQAKVASKHHRKSID